MSKQISATRWTTVARAIFLGAIAIAGLVLLTMLLRRTDDGPAQDAAVRGARSEGDSPALEAGGLGRIVQSAPSVLPDNSDLAASDGSIGGLGVEIYVMDSAGAILSGATVVRLEDEGFEVLGRTGERGLVRVDRAALNGQLVAAWKSDFAPRRVRVPEAAPDRIEIRLRPAITVSGSVVTPDGARVGPGVRVLLWSHEDGATNADGARALSGDPSALTSVTDLGGAFTVTGLDASRRYSAAAGGAGFVAPNFVRSIVPGSTDLRIVVERAYATWIRLREQGGAPLRTSSTLYGRGFGTPRVTDPSVHWLSGALPQFGLLGIPNGGIRQQDLANRLYIVTSPRDAESVGPVELQLKYPGYEAVHASLDVPRLADPIHEAVVEFAAGSTEFASMRVVFSGLPASGIASNESEPFGVIRILDRRGSASEYAVRDPGRGALQIDGIPVGRYELEFETLSGSYRFPASDEQGLAVDVGSEGAEVTVDLGPTGSAQVVVLHRDSTELSGPATLMCRRADGREYPARVFGRSPYVLSGLPGGLYSVYLDQPRLGDRRIETAQAHSADFVIEPGQLVRVELRVAD